MNTPQIHTVTDWEQAAKFALSEMDRKDALLRRALDVLTINVDARSFQDYFNVRNAVTESIKKELT